MTSPANPPSTGMRLSALAIVVLSLVGALTARLWYLTVVEGEASVEATEANSTRTIHIQAPRGRIFDRNYQMLVDNRQVRQLRIDEHELDTAVAFESDDRNEVYQRVADALNRFEVTVESGDVVAAARLVEEEAGGSEAEVIRAGQEAERRAADATWTVDVVRGALQNNRVSPFVPTPVAVEVPEDLEVLLAENQHMYPGVEVEPVAVRHYPHRTLAAHLLGYVKAINEDELASDAVQEETEKPYAPGDDIGKSGVELAYEEYLRGVPGERVIEVDADNNPVRTISYRPPVPGYDLMLEMDVRVQALLELSLREQAEANDAPGAAGVVMDPTSGGIVAMASYPSYDPVELSGRVSEQRFDELTNQENGAALTNKAIDGQYFPGSTFKVVTALAGLRAGIITPDFAWNDTGEYQIQGCEGSEGCFVQNAGEVALGTVELAGSLTQSSDTYYYRIGDQLWGARDRVGEEALQEVAHEFGFAEDTGVDLPSSADGYIWTPEYLTEYCQENECVDGADQRWRSGDNVNLSIGQGYLAVTPLQLTNMYGALANGGVLHTPHVAHSVLERHPDRNEWTEVVRIAPEEHGRIEMRPEWRDRIIQGLLGVPQAGPGGTAADAFEGFDLAGYPIAGKTGTSQKEGEGDYALFSAFGPVRNGRVPEAEPSYVVTTVFEAVAQFGGTVAAPPARQVFDGLRDSAYLPVVPCSYQATPIAATQPSECPDDGSVPDTGVVTPPVEEEG